MSEDFVWSLDFKLRKFLVPDRNFFLGMADKAP